MDFVSKDPKADTELHDIPLSDLEANYPNASLSKLATTKTDKLFRYYVISQICLKYIYFNALVLYLTCFLSYIAVAIIETGRKHWQPGVQTNGHRTRDALAVGVLVSPVVTMISSKLRIRHINRANKIRREQAESGEPIWRPLSYWIEETDTDRALVVLSAAMLALGILVITIFETL